MLRIERASGEAGRQLLLLTRTTSDDMADKTFNVLILCTGNSARSIMAEALLNTMGRGLFRAYSAGSHPGGVVNPLAIEQIAATGYPLENLRSKSWDEFADPGAPTMDFVITVCDDAAGETCPVWPGHPLTAHWGFEDPAAATGTIDERRRVFAKVYRQIMNRVHLFERYLTVWVAHERGSTASSPGSRSGLASGRCCLASRGPSARWRSPMSTFRWASSSGS